MSSPSKAGKTALSLGIPLATFALVLWVSLGGEAATPAPAVRRRPVEADERPFSEPGVVTIVGREREPSVSIPVNGSEKTVGVSCATCHTTQPARLDMNDGSKLQRFHSGLKTAHGGLTCASCHDAPTYDALRLADGRRLEFGQAQMLCAQCHGPQYRDYTHGSHGGMTGYWDLSQGGRVRNACIVCHDPHAPAYPKFEPARGPNDRFLPPGEPTTAPKTPSEGQP